MPEEESLYVGIKTPSDLRRDILLATKSIINSLKKYERFKETRREKVEAMFEFRTIIEELIVLNRKLRSEMPKTSMRPEPAVKEIKKMHLPKKRHHKKQGKTVRFKPMHKTKLDVLEEELSKIEGKLSHLEG